MKRYRVIFLFFLLVLFLGTGFGLSEEVFTWEECVSEAKKNHPELILAREKLKQAKYENIISKSSLLPSVNGSLNTNASGGERTDSSKSYSYGVSASQLLFDGFKTHYEVKSSKENLKLAEYEYEVTSSNVRLQLRKAFIELLKYQELLKITEEIAHRRRQNAEIVKLGYKSGREHKGSLLTAQANVAQAEFEVIQAKQNIELAQKRLIKELGRTKFSSLIVKEDINISLQLDEKPNFEKLADENPVIKELVSKEKIAKLDLKSDKANFYPEVNANISAQRSSSSWPPDNGSWSARVSLSLPLYHGGSYVARVLKSKSALLQADINKKAGRDNIIVTLEESWINLKNTIKEAMIRKKFLEADISRSEIAKAQYLSGLISFDNWIIIEDNLVKTKKSFLDAQINVLIAEANWIHAKGGTLDYEE